MRQPSITDYVATLENPLGVFRTLGAVEVLRDIYGEPQLVAGNSAAIFTYRDAAGGRRLLKCYIRPNPHLRAVYDYVARTRPPLLPDVGLLRDEMYVLPLAGEGRWVDVVEGEWVQGRTLNMAVARAAPAGETGRLRALSRAFDEMCRRLLRQPWAHGDLKPENIIVRDVETGVGTDASAVAPPELTLIDCDAMWIPPLAGQHAAELGTPAYRHPGRTPSHFDKRIDDYPMVLMSASLHALSMMPELYAKYNTDEGLVISPGEMLSLFRREGMARELRMVEALAAPLPEDVNAARFFADAPTAASGALESFVEGGKWGFADGTGTAIIQPFWDEVLEFRDGRARVRLGDRWLTIDVCGKNVF